MIQQCHPETISIQQLPPLSPKPQPAIARITVPRSRHLETQEFGNLGFSTLYRSNILSIKSVLPKMSVMFGLAIKNFFPAPIGPPIRAISGQCLHGQDNCRNVSWWAHGPYSNSAGLMCWCPIYIHMHCYQVFRPGFQSSNTSAVAKRIPRYPCKLLTRVPVHPDLE